MNVKAVRLAWCLRRRQRYVRLLRKVLLLWHSAWVRRRSGRCIACVHICPCSRGKRHKQHTCRRLGSRCGMFHLIGSIYNDRGHP